MPQRILVVDDDVRVRESVARVLSSERTTVTAVESAEQAIASLAQTAPDLVISDIRMPGMDGLSLLGLLRDRAPGVAVALMTAYDDLPTVAAAMRAGAADLLVKPLDLHQLRAVVDKVFADRRARSDHVMTVANESKPNALIGRDPRMLEIFKIIGQLAGSRANVIIRGESGTGKELVARAIHELSPNARDPFVAVNCTALPATLLESELFGHTRGAFTGATADRRGRFAVAGRGTIFLDEIGDTSNDFQAKLLRVLQEQEYYPVGAEQPQRTQARVLAATHRNLEDLVSRGEFRQDLYYRLRVVEIQLPPLRERARDIPELAHHLVRKAAHAAGSEPPVLSEEALSLLVSYGWPGNVRELENCVMRAVVLATGGVIRPQHLAIQGTAGVGTPRFASLDEVEAGHVRHVLEAVNGNRTRAAEMLGVSRPRLRRLIEKHALEGESEADNEPDEV